MTNTQALGEHILIELYECKTALLDNSENLEEIFLEAARRAKAHVIKTCFHQFSPVGVSGVVVVAESHLAVHTWPEYAYAAVDIFTCSPKMDYWAAFEFLKEKLESQKSDFKIIRRGSLIENVEKLEK